MGASPAGPSASAESNPEIAKYSPTLRFNARINWFVMQNVTGTPSPLR
jgi:hypothetical protein